MRSVICSFCVGRALLYHQRESFYDCERSLCRGLQRWQLAASRDQQARAKGQEGPEWLKCSLKMAPMGWQAQRCKTWNSMGATNSKGPQMVREQRCKT